MTKYLILTTKRIQGGSMEVNVVCLAMGEMLAGELLVEEMT